MTTHIWRHKLCHC